MLMYVSAGRMDRHLGIGGLPKKRRAADAALRVSTCLSYWLLTAGRRQVLLGDRTLVAGPRRGARRGNWRQDERVSVDGFVGLLRCRHAECSGNLAVGYVDFGNIATGNAGVGEAQTILYVSLIYIFSSVGLNILQHYKKVTTLR